MQIKKEIEHRLVKLNLQHDDILASYWRDIRTMIFDTEGDVDDLLEELCDVEIWRGVYRDNTSSYQTILARVFVDFCLRCKQDEILTSSIGKATLKAHERAVGLLLNSIEYEDETTIFVIEEDVLNRYEEICDVAGILLNMHLEGSSHFLTIIIRNILNRSKEEKADE